MKVNRYTPNPNRHLWNNNGWWWMRVQPWHPLKTERFAINLRTKNVEEARKTRDQILAVQGWRLAA